MGDLATLAKARRELEELYSGVPDESVNLTFQDLAEVKQNHTISLEKNKSFQLEPISKSTPKRLPLTKLPTLEDFNMTLEPSTNNQASHNLTKLPSLDFSRAIEASKIQYNHRHRDVKDTDDSPTSHRSHPFKQEGMHFPQGRHYAHIDHASSYTPQRELGFKQVVEKSMAYDNMSIMSGTSMASVNHSQERGGRRRLGIPHSKICTICSTYIYLFRHRCLVCGRVYCKQCVSEGMGEMTEGRKCVECLGRKFSQRYIQRAGQIGCCIGMGYPSIAKQQELKWAEKGPRRSGENGHRSGMVSRSRSPMTPRSPRTPTRAHHASSSSTPSFVMNSPYSTYSPTNHPLPF